MVAIDGIVGHILFWPLVSVSGPSINPARLILLNVLDTEPWSYLQSANAWATEDELRKVYADEILEGENILAKIKEKLKRLTFSQRPKS